jgi:cell division topological specificity factor
MKLFTFFKPRGTAPVARERLQILLAHERIALGPHNLIAILRDEILATIAKHVEIGPEALTIKMGQTGAISTLEIDVEIPTEKIDAKPGCQESPRATAA